MKRQVGQNVHQHPQDTTYHQLGGEPTSFCFVSPTLIYAPLADDAPIIMLYSLDPSVASTGINHIATLGLPRIESTVCNLRGYSEPVRSNTSSRALDTVLGKRYHVFNIDMVRHSTYELASYMLCVPTTLFLEFQRLYEQNESTTGPIVARWDEWAPLRTRLLPISTQHNFARCVLTLYQHRICTVSQHPTGTFMGRGLCYL